MDRDWKAGSSLKKTGQDDQKDDFQSIEDIDQGDLDMSQISNKIWLVKVPKFLADYWSSVDEDDQILGWVRVGQQEESTEQKIKISLPEAIAKARKLPKEYNLSVMNKYPLNSYMFEETTTQIPEKNATLKKAALTGKVAHECFITPIADDAYRSVMSFRNKSANIMKRSIKLIDDRGGNLHPGNAPPRKIHSSFVRNQKQRSGNELKNIRLPRSELLDALFKCFERYEYWSTKGLRELLKQPETYLKEVLEKIAVLQRSGPYDSKWYLKPEYKASLSKSNIDAAKKFEQETQLEMGNSMMEDVDVSDSKYSYEDVKTEQY